MPNFPSAGIPTTPERMTEYVIGYIFHGRRMETIVEAYSLDQAEEEAKEYRDDMVPFYAEECEEREEDRPIVM